MSEWISVEDRTPEDYGEYLVAWLPNDCPFPDTKTCFIGICEYELSSTYDQAKNRFKGEWLTESIDTTGQYGGIDIYAWMELPEQYVIGKVKRGGTKEPCDNAVSRQAVLDKKELVELEDGQSFYCISPEDVEALPSVTPQLKTGHWIRWYERKENDGCIEHIPHCKCSECGKKYDPHSSQFIKYCSKCGAKMVEPQERSDKE